MKIKTAARFLCHGKDFGCARTRSGGAQIKYITHSAYSLPSVPSCFFSPGTNAMIVPLRQPKQPRVRYKQRLVHLHPLVWRTIVFNIGSLYGTCADDNEKETRQLVQALEGKGYTVRHVVTGGSHDWKQWKALVDDGLQAFVGTGADGRVDGPKEPE